MPPIPEELSILRVRGFVFFPGTVMPLTVSRPASIKLLDETLAMTKIIGLVTQRDEQGKVEEPGETTIVVVANRAAPIALNPFRVLDQERVMHGALKLGVGRNFGGETRRMGRVHCFR